jgi:methylmalonyl-CoA mutase, N-terminal domain
MTARFGAKSPRSSALRFHAQTAGCSLTAQQPYNNVVRTAVQALAAVMGGAQSLHTNSLDEAWALPTEFAATLALRTQQILAHETGVANTVDPLGGSYFVEKLTNEMEDAAAQYICKIDDIGGMIPAIERGYPQREIADASYRYQVSADRKEKIIVGVNEFAGAETPIEILRIGESVREQQVKQLHKLRNQRSSDEVARQLKSLRQAAQGTENLMPHIYAAVKAYATLGEICDSLREIFGTHEETSIT